MGELILRPTAPVPRPFTEERLTSEYGGQTEIKRLHQYLLAREWCRNKDVLDVASGEGYGTALLAQVAKKAIGVEIAPDAVVRSTLSYTQENLTYVQGDARVLPLRDASLDVVISFGTIEHFAEQQQFLNEVRRVLRPGGLFVVSTPDRDNYSRVASPVNAGHVKEMTVAEFEALLRSSFVSVSLVLQRPIFGSVLLPAETGDRAPLCFERRGATHFEGSVGLARPQYIVAFASDGPAAVLEPSVYIESGRLGTLDPEESARQLKAAEAATATEHDSPFRMRQETETLQQRTAALVADVKACQLELAAARGEVKGLLAAALQRQANLTSYLRMRQVEADLASMRISYSWRVTAPLRRISHLLRRGFVARKRR